jgi:hypothetical protein
MREVAAEMTVAGGPRGRPTAAKTNTHFINKKYFLSNAAT